MSLDSLQQAVRAYFIADHAMDLTIANRFYPRGELEMIWEDKIAVAVRKFGRKAKAQAKPVAVTLIDELIEQGAYTSTENDFGGTMHQFQAEQYRKVIAGWQFHPNGLTNCAQGRRCPR